MHKAEPTITCEKCGVQLEVERRCSRVRLKCKGCQREFQIHEVASRLDSATEAILGQYPTIIYD